MKKPAKQKKHKESKLVTYACILVIFFMTFSALLLHLSQTIKFGGILGTDFKFHYAIAEEYAQGKNGLVSDNAFNVNGGPYPPLFHLLLAIGIKLHFAVPLAILMQVLMFPLLIAIVSYIVYKHIGLRTAAMTSAILFSSVAILDRAQAIPQSIDMICFPLAIYFFLNNKRWQYIVSMLIPIYSHGMWALTFLAGMLLYSIVKKENVQYNVLAILFSIPMIALTWMYLPGYMAVHDGQPQSAQEVYATEPVFFMEYLGILIAVVAIIFAIYLVATTIRDRRFTYRFTKLETVALFWLLAMVPLLFFLIDRFCSYAAPPIAILCAGFVTRMTANREKLFVTLLILMAAIAFIYQSLILWAYMVEKKDIFISTMLEAHGIIPTKTV